MMQDFLALAIAAAAAAWLGWALTRRLFAPPCQPPDAPPGSDGFVPLDALNQAAGKKSGRPGGRPDH